MRKKTAVLTLIVIAGAAAYWSMNTPMSVSKEPTPPGTPCRRDAECVTDKPIGGLASYGCMENKTCGWIPFDK